MRWHLTLILERHSLMLSNKLFLKARNPKNSTWEVNRLEVPKIAHRATCKSSMPAGKLFVQVNSLFIPPKQTFTVERTFYFCALQKCVKPARYSNINPTHGKIYHVCQGNITQDDKHMLQSCGFNIHL